MKRTLLFGGLALAATLAIGGWQSAGQPAQKPTTTQKPTVKETRPTSPTERQIDWHALAGVIQANQKRNALIDPCPNGGFEMGNLTGYGTFEGGVQNGHWVYQNCGQVDSPNPMAPGHILLPHTGADWQAHAYVGSNNQIQYMNWNGGEDPFLAAIGGIHMPVPFPGGGKHVLRLGQIEPHRQRMQPSLDEYLWPDAWGVTYSFVVTPANQDFTFRWAAVLDECIHTQETVHQPWEQASFGFALIYPPGSWSGSGGFNSTAPPAVVNSFEAHAVAGPGSVFKVAYTRPSYDRWDYTGIQCDRVHIPDAYLGKTVTATFVARTCMMGEHTGYVYIDNLCDPTIGVSSFTLDKDEYCDKDPIMVDATNNLGATNFTWTMEECDPSGRDGAVAGTTVQGPNPGSPAGPFDISRWYKQHGKTIKCGRYYRIRVDASPLDCGVGKSITKYVYIACCGSSAQPCCSGEITLGRETLEPSKTSGAYAFHPTISYSGRPVKSVAMQLMNAQVKVVPSNCGGYSGPVSAYIASAGTSSGLGSPQLLANPYPRRVNWPVGSGSLSSTPLPALFAFPKPQGGPCKEYLEFRVRFEVVDVDCHTCELQRTYYFRRQAGSDGPEPGPIPITPDQWPGAGIH